MPWLRLVWEAQGDKFTLRALGFLEPAEPQLREGGREEGSEPDRPGNLQGPRTGPSTLPFPRPLPPGPAGLHGGRGATRSR